MARTQPRKKSHPTRRDRPPRREPRKERSPRPARAPVVPDFPMGPTGRPHARRHPPVGFGLWSMGRWDLLAEEATRAATQRALELGIRWFDTAEVYGGGRSERTLGSVLARTPAPKSPPLIVTKASWEHLRPDQLRSALLGSLQRLGRESVDIYLIHAPDRHVPLLTTMSAMEELVDEGRVGGIGVSNFSLDQLQEASRLLQRHPLLVSQVRYNLFEPQDGEEIRAFCRSEGIVLEAYSPLARGFLAGRYLDGTPPPRGDPRTGHGPFAGDRFEAFVRRARALDKLARSAGVPMASLALHWVVRQGAAPLFGGRTAEQVDQVVRAWNHRPSEKDLDRAEAIAGGRAG